MPSVGDEFDGFRIDSVLGRGAMGVVYAATDLSLKREVAIKVLARQLSTDDVFSERFRQEASIQANLEHPHIVAVHAFGEVEGELYLAMRLIRGNPLSTVLGEGWLSRTELLDLLAQVADALDSAHDVGLVHRDVKPDNILVAERGDAFLADFGLTRDITNDLRMTKSGMFLGTVNYVSPEQALGLPLTAAADTYSLAAVLFECMTGQVPYVHDSAVAVLYAHIQDPIPSACALKPALPAAMDAVLAAGLAKDAVARPGSAVELIDLARSALSAAAGTVDRRPPMDGAAGDETVAPDDVPTVRAPRRADVRRRSLATRGVVVALALASLAGGITLGQPSRQGESPPTRTVRGSALSLWYSRPWTVASSAAKTPGLTLEKTVSLRRGDGLSLVAGVGRAHDATLLPAALTRRLPGNVTPDDRIKVGDAEAVRYGDVVVTGSATHMRLVAVPSKDHVTYVVCTRAAALTEADQQACERIVNTLRVAGKTLALAPRTEYAHAVARALSMYERARSALRDKLERATRPGPQADALRSFVSTCRSSASALANSPAGPQEETLQAAIDAASDRVCVAYRDLANAAGDYDRAAYNSARIKAASAQRALRRSVRALDALGY